MKLAVRTLRAKIDSAESLGAEARLRCELAREFEEAGDYEAARETMGDFWRRVGERPRLEGLDEYAAAEVLLRAGALSGWLGSSGQVHGSQEAAKDLISESASLFAALGETEKVVEARTELAYCYWREGAFDEARVVLAESLKTLGDGGGELKAVALLRTAIVEASATRYHDALGVLTDAAPLFESSASHALKGKFHNELASVLNYLAAAERRADYADRAFIEYAAASFHFAQAGHARYEAAVENNLGFLFMSAGRFEEAHKHLDRARRLFLRLKDGAHTAQVNETRARVLLAEGRLAEAERTARLAAQALERGGESALLVEALITHGTALARLERHEPALAALRRATEVAQKAGDSDGAGLAALTTIEELGARLNFAELRALYERADQFLAGTQHPGILRRLRRAAGSVLGARAEGGAREDKAMSASSESRSASAAPVRLSESVPSRSQEEEPDELWENFSLKEEVRRIEEHYITLALKEAGGKVSRAAKLLGFDDHGSLNSLLKNKHTKLLKAKLPVAPRRRSIMLKGKS